MKKKFLQKAKAQKLNESISHYLTIQRLRRPSAFEGVSLSHIDERPKLYNLLVTHLHVDHATAIQIDLKWISYFVSSKKIHTLCEINGMWVLLIRPTTYDKTFWIIFDALGQATRTLIISSIKEHFGSGTNNDSAAQINQEKEPTLKRYFFKRRASKLDITMHRYESRHLY